MERGQFSTGVDNMRDAPETMGTGHGRGLSSPLRTRTTHVPRFMPEPICVRGRAPPVFAATPGLAVPARAQFQGASPTPAASQAENGVSIPVARPSVARSSYLGQRVNTNTTNTETDFLFRGRRPGGTSPPASSRSASPCSGSPSRPARQPLTHLVSEARLRSSQGHELLARLHLRLGPALWYRPGLLHPP